jgi:hypothetical protein
MARNGSTPPHHYRRVRVRSRPLEEIDETKLAVALSIMARRLIEQRVTPDPNPAERPDTDREVA